MKIESYSQCGQDLFVFSLIKNKGKFLDLGCYLPKKINNTYLLELNGWTGVSVDIVDYTDEWKERSTLFINEDCFNINFEDFLPKYFVDKTIDYLSLDMEKMGERYKLLNKILNTNYDFKIITIEHDSYLGYEFEVNEKTPQREILTRNGYILICSDVSQKNHPTLYYEDWWVNKKYFTEDNINTWFSDKLSCDNIFTKSGVDYLVNEISQSW